VDVIEVFSPRRSGPWHLLHPLRTRFGFAVLVIVVLVLLVRHQQALAAVVAAVDLVLIVLSFAFVWQLVGLLIRARAELVVLAAGLATDRWLVTLMPAVWAGVTLASLALVAFTLPWSHRFLMGRVWCVIDRHRLRLCLRQTKVRTMNMDGSLPLLLWAHPTKIGERVWVWVRAGSSADDIEDAIEYIAPACYAREARVHRVRKLTTFVGIDIIRRDPLANPTPVASRLAKLTSLVTGGLDTAAEGTEAVRPVPLSDITTTDLPAPSRGKTTKTPSTSATPAGPVVVANGEDLSDYIDD
jgi:hypothetical protein